MITREIVLELIKAMVDLLKNDNMSSNLSVSSYRDGHKYIHTVVFDGTGIVENKWKSIDNSTLDEVDISEEYVASLLSENDIIFIGNMIEEAMDNVLRN